MQLRNPNSIMQEDYDESISLTLRTRSSKKPYPENKEFKETIRNARKFGNTNGSSHALQDLQEKQAWGDP